LLFLEMTQLYSSLIPNIKLNRVNVLALNLISMIFLVKLLILMLNVTYIIRLILTITLITRMHTSNSFTVTEQVVLLFLYKTGLSTVQVLMNSSQWTLLFLAFN